MTLVYSLGITHMSVCTADTDDDMLAIVNAGYPTGLDHGWQIADEPFADGSPNPSPCGHDPELRHVLLVC